MVSAGTGSDDHEDPSQIGFLGFVLAVLMLASGLCLSVLGD